MSRPEDRDDKKSTQRRCDSKHRFRVLYIFYQVSPSTHQKALKTIDEEALGSLELDHDDSFSLSLLKRGGKNVYAR